MPEKADEVVIDNQISDSIKIGDKITIDSDLVLNKTLTVTGYVESPLYISTERDSTTLLSGQINYFLYMKTENILSPVKTTAYIKLDTDEDADKAFSQITKALEDLGYTLDEIINKEYIGY